MSDIFKVWLCEAEDGRACGSDSLRTRRRLSGLRPHQKALPSRGDAESAMLEEKFHMLDKWSVVASSPWDGLQDIMTIQLSVEYEGRKKEQKEIARGLEELLLAVHVLSQDGDRWSKLSQICSRLHQLLSRQFSNDDAYMLSLLFGLELLDSHDKGEAADMKAFVDKSLEELRGRGIFPSSVKQQEIDEETEGKRGQKGKVIDQGASNEVRQGSQADDTNGNLDDKEEEGEEQEEEDDDEEEEEMTWRNLLGKYCEEFRLVLQAQSIDKGIRILEERRSKLKADLPEDHTSSLKLHMANCLVGVERKILGVSIHVLQDLSKSVLVPGSEL
eukprot:760234-Hanusia_phi.AAC.4